MQRADMKTVENDVYVLESSLHYEVHSDNQLDIS
jgi:hypothetical protein